MNRRDFLGIAGASIFAPIFGRWYRQGSGLVVPMDPPGFASVTFEDQFTVGEGGRVFVVFSHHRDVLTIRQDVETPSRYARITDPKPRRLTNRAMFQIPPKPVPMHLEELHVTGGARDFAPGDRIRIVDDGLASWGKVVTVRSGRQYGSRAALDAAATAAAAGGVAATATRPGQTDPARGLVGIRRGVVPPVSTTPPRGPWLPSTLAGRRGGR